MQVMNSIIKEEKKIVRINKSRKRARKISFLRPRSDENSIQYLSNLIFIETKKIRASSQEYEINIEGRKVEVGLRINKSF